MKESITYSKYIEKELNFDQLDKNYKSAIKKYSYNLSEEELNNYHYLVGGISINKVKRLIMKNHPDEFLKDFSNFDKYHHWYISHEDTPFYEDIWPIIIATGCVSNEIIEDGWHRFHSYIRSGIKSIPFVIYAKINKKSSI